MTLTSGSFVQLTNKPDGTYQVVSLDDASDSCWVRRWPLARNGSPPFSVPLQHVIPSVAALR
ncbi:hypothetical protein [Cyanobium sp. Morenito 9A2]|uniref:hypothetical protein n=1 Tax=Cyanobium sp. Morenito 9A2 TaxID=2823718 RepID=UPI0020CEB12F|nr:hypothetical protein [Cyanobium sp. Morenito 9A2]MCP9848629.1 hypothetical protein [Cyanobium sp. Morenito 9A2]